MKDDTRILIIGGYGNTGRLLARLLLERTEASIHLILAGRNEKRARALAAELNRDVSHTNRVTGRFLDASDKSSLLKAFQDVHLVVVASSTATYVEQIAKRAIDTGTDYLDINYSRSKIATLQSMQNEIKNSGLCFITDGGFHPGLPSVLVRHIARYFQHLDSAVVGSLIRIDWASLESMSTETMEEFAGEFVDFTSNVYKEGTWKDAGIMASLNPRKMDFGKPFGLGYCIPCYLEELKELPTMFPHISETGFYVGGLNWAVDWIISPIVMLALKIWPLRAKRAMGRFLYWGLRTFSSPPYRTILKVEAKGEGKDGRPLEKSLMVSHEDGYALTAIPVAATIAQYLSEKESIHKPGLWFQANIVDPERLLVDMNDMGVKIVPALEKL